MGVMRPQPFSFFYFIHLLTSTIMIETNGANAVPDSERYGQPKDLFPIWFSWNISIFGITLGFYVYGLGLSPLQAMIAGVLGYIISCMFVGILAVGSVRTGLPTLVQSRIAFGYHGNKFPAFFGYLANMGWKVTMLGLATTTFADLLAKIWPALADGTRPSVGCTVFAFIVIILLTMVGAVYGHRLILKIEKAVAWVTGLMTLGYLFFFLPHIDLSLLDHVEQTGSSAVFVGGVVLAMTMVGLGFLNYGGDYARYLPRQTPGRGVVFWTTLGIALPVSVLLILGVMLCVGNPQLREVANHEPLVAVLSILPMWFYYPFAIVVIISLISAGMTGIYSSGLALLAIGVPLSRWASTVFNAVLISFGVWYLLFISDSFVSTFTSFLSVVSTVLGSWGAIEMIDLIRQRRMGWPTHLANVPGQGGVPIRWSAFVSLLVATIVGLGTITSSDPYIQYVTGFLLTESLRNSVFVAGSMGLVLAMVVGSVLYALLTFSCPCSCSCQGKSKSSC